MATDSRGHLGLHLRFQIQIWNVVTVRVVPLHCLSIDPSTLFGSTPNAQVLGPALPTNLDPLLKTSSVLDTFL